MSELIVETEVLGKSKRAEGNSGRLPNKLRFTSPTFLSLQKNKKNKLLEKAFQNLNEKYSELFSAVEIEEKVKAEEEVRRKVSGSDELEQRVEEDETISKMTSAEVVLPRLKKVSISLLKLEGRIGTYKNNFGINVKKGFAQKPPKAITVKKLYTKAYKSMFNKIDLYKLAKKKGIDVAKEGGAAVEEADLPSWRKLFSNVSNTTQNVTVAMNKSKRDEEEEEYVPIVSNNKVSEEDLSYRKMLSQLGDEFELIESYEKSPNGIPLQFKDGFESRKNNLSKIFLDLTGIESTKDKSKIELNIKDDTEFQKLIDDVNGYKEPLTEEEHKKMEEMYNEYYNREDVKTKIRDLQEKDVLSTFNQHMDDVLKAESEYNNKNAMVSIADSEVETKASEEVLDKANELDEIKKGAWEQARMLKTLYDYIDARDEFEAKKQEEERQMKEMIKESAQVEAQRIHENNIILDSAEEEARRIYNSQKEELDKQALDKMIKESAEVEAKKMVNQELQEIENEKTQKMIIDSAKEEAQNIINKEKQEEEDRKTLELIQESAQQEAQRINDLNQVIDGAQEQAEMLYQEKMNSDRKELLDGAKATAALIHDKNLIADSIDAQARELQSNNEYLDIVESAEVQARILLSKDKKAKLLQDAKELREKLKSIDEEASKIDESIQEFVESDEMDNSIGEVPQESNSSGLVKMEDAYFDPEIINSAEMEAKRLNDLNLIADCVEIEAKRLNDLNQIAESAEFEARRLNDLSKIAESAEFEAQRIHEQNLIADSALVEAQKIHEQNLIADSAKEEAKKIYDNNSQVGEVVVSQEAQTPEVVSTPIVQKVEAPQVMNSTETSEVVNNPIVQKVQPTQTAPVVQTTSEPVKPVQTSFDNILELLDNSDRYGELTAKSNALLVKQTRIDSISKRVNSKSNPVNKKKEILTSLKEELETGNYSFLKRSEDLEKTTEMAKVA